MQYALDNRDIQTVVSLVEDLRSRNISIPITIEFIKNLVPSQPVVLQSTVQYDQHLDSTQSNGVDHLIQLRNLLKQKYNLNPVECAKILKRNPSSFEEACSEAEKYLKQRG